MCVCTCVCVEGEQRTPSEDCQKPKKGTEREQTSPRLRHTGGRLTNKHPVLVGVTGVLDDGDDVGSFLGHVYQVAPTPVRKLHGVHKALLCRGK